MELLVAEFISTKLQNQGRSESLRGGFLLWLLTNKSYNSSILLQMIDASVATCGAPELGSVGFVTNQEHLPNVVATGMDYFFECTVALSYYT